MIDPSVTGIIDRIRPFGTVKLLRPPGAFGPLDRTGGCWKFTAPSGASATILPQQGEVWCQDPSGRDMTPEPERGSDDFIVARIETLSKGDSA